ncbi:MAG: hypothetical protein EXR92_03695 [Gemmatimonadetes bacterium]|nr:hypothetical protein [Gemmatimonadota bacterium]
MGTWDSRPDDGPIPEEEERTVGLCGSCRFRRSVSSTRGSRFVLCLRSQEDPTFPRYPLLPIHRCDGFEATG